MFMRLPPQYAEFIKAEVTALRTGASVYLFGSRRDESRKGGDIDILVLSNPKLAWEEAAQIRRRDHHGRIAVGDCVLHAHLFVETKK